MTISSCSISEREEIVATRQIYVLLLPHEIGDMGYGDCVLRGFQTIRRDTENMGVDMHIYRPNSIEEGEAIFNRWLDLDNHGQPSLFVLTANDYEAILADYFAFNEQLPEGKDILLFESHNMLDFPIYNFTISPYGASYLAGVTAAHCSSNPALIAWGNSMDLSTTGAVEGFMTGFHSFANDRAVTAYSLAEDWTGYIMANEAYKMMTEWSREYGFIYPIAGGTSNGIYRYLREHPDGPYTAGYDIDASHLSSQVVGSTVKHIDRLIVDYIKQWLDTNTMPQKYVYGLDSGYIEWLLAPDYKSMYQDIVDSQYEIAIQKEMEYEEDI